MKLVKLLGDKIDPAVSTELNEVVQEQVLETLNENQIVKIVNELDSDDAVEILENMNDEEQEHIIQEMIPAGMAQHMAEQPDIEQRVFERGAVDAEQVHGRPAVRPLAQKEHQERQQKKGEDHRRVVLQLQRKFSTFRNGFILSRPAEAGYFLLPAGSAPCISVRFLFAEHLGKAFLVYHVFPFPKSPAPAFFASGQAAFFVRPLCTAH